MSRCGARMDSVEVNVIEGSGQHRHGRHRDVAANGARAAVLGAGDGLITNVSLVLGVAGAHPSAATVRLAGLAGGSLPAHSRWRRVSSSRSEHRKSSYDREVNVEKGEIADDHRAASKSSFAEMYEHHGLAHDDAEKVAAILMSKPDVALDAHARLELGVDPEEPPSARKAALASFVSFSFSALDPAVSVAVLVWNRGHRGVDRSPRSPLFVLGAMIGSFTGAGVVRTALRQLFAATVAAAVTYTVGSLLGPSAG